MDWSLGVSLSSNTCRSLNTPHLKLQLKVAETREEMKIKNVEMSLAEFQVITCSYNGTSLIKTP